MENKSIKLWDELARLCLIQARKAVETEENKIPNAACIEVAGKLASVAAFIEQLKASLKVVSCGTASQGTPAQAGNDVKELVEKFKKAFVAGEQFKAPLSFVLEHLKSYGETKNTP